MKTCSINIPRFLNLYLIHQKEESDSKSKPTVWDTYTACFRLKVMSVRYTLVKAYLRLSIENKKFKNVRVFIGQRLRSAVWGVEFLVHDVSFSRTSE